MKQHLKIENCELCTENRKKEFIKELKQLINKYAIENYSDTHDLILSEYLSNCLSVFEKATSKRVDLDEKKSGTG